MKTILVILSIFGSATLLPASVGVSHVTSGFGPNDFHVFQKFDKSDYTGFVFSHLSGSSYRYGGSYLDEGLDLYRVFSGDRFTPGGITNGDFVEFAMSAAYNVPLEFYVGLETPTRDLGFATLPPAYGWAKLSSSNGVLTVLDSAIDYSGNGLIVGTTTVIPEPCAHVLFAMGLTCMLQRRSRGQVIRAERRACV